MFLASSRHLAVAVLFLSSCLSSPVVDQDTSGLQITTSAQESGTADSSTSPVLANNTDAPTAAIAGSEEIRSANTPASAFSGAQKLLPAVHWNTRLQDVQNLAPVNSSRLYYTVNGTSDPRIEHSFASVLANFRYRSVDLNLSSRIESISCTSGGVSVKFKTDSAFRFASESWPSSQDFVLVTHTNGCGQSPDQRTFWLVNGLSLQNETKSIVAKIKEELAVDKALEAFDLVWGTHQTSQSTNATREQASATQMEKRAEITKSAVIKVHAPTDAPSPWGQAAQLLYQTFWIPQTRSTGSVKLYCVDCGFSSRVVLAGRAKWSFRTGFETLNVEFDAADVQAKFQLGLVASATWQGSKSQRLVDQNIPDLSIRVPSLFTAGLYITVDAVGTIDLAGQGEVLTGVTMTAPHFNALLNIKDQNTAKTSSLTGFRPQWKATPVRFADHFAATANLSLPIGLHFGVSVPLAKFDKSVTLIEQPSISARFTLNGKKSNGSATGSSCKNGMGWVVDAHNAVTLDAFGFQKFPLEHYDSGPLAQGCW